MRWMFIILLALAMGCKKKRVIEEPCIEFSSTEITLPDSLRLVNCSDVIIRVQVLSISMDTLFDPSDTIYVNFNQPGITPVYYMNARALATGPFYDKLVIVN